MKDGKSKEDKWMRVDSGKFWREISHPDHLVHVYESNDQLLDQLYAFAAGGFDQGESVVIIATGDHIRQLSTRLQDKGYDVFGLKLRDQFITLDANQTLYEFIINGSPDDILFRLLAANLMKRAKRAGRKVRAFGEMVAILWAQGHAEASLCLEQLWSEYMQDESFCLLCAYPATSFAESTAGHTLEHVCSAHSHHLASVEDASVISYRRTGTAD